MKGISERVMYRLAIGNTTVEL